jgi:RNA polymerase sigma-70 factor (ECF subfamily)
MALVLELSGTQVAQTRDASVPSLVALDDTLSALAVVDERKSRVVELKFFGGLSTQETAAVSNVSSETVVRDWKMAKVWLLREMSERRSNGA